MNRLRGRAGREMARVVSAMLEEHSVQAYQPFWKGYRDAARELGLMIRTNGLPLALALAIGRAGIAGDSFHERKGEDEKSGRERAVVDLACHLNKTINGPATLVAFVDETARAGRTEYIDLVEAALSVLLWQKALSAARVLPEEKTVADGPTKQGATTP